MIEVHCAKCNAGFNAPDQAAGRTARCKKCGAALVVPTPGPDFDPDPEPEPPPIHPEAVKPLRFKPQPPPLPDGPPAYVPVVPSLPAVRAASANDLREGLAHLNLELTGLVLAMFSTLLPLFAPVAFFVSLRAWLVSKAGGTGARIGLIVALVGCIELLFAATVVYIVVTTGKRPHFLD